MTTRPSTAGYGVGYALAASELRLGVIEPLHAVDPRTGRAFCGSSLPICWSAEDARSTAVDCEACLSAIADGRRG